MEKFKHSIFFRIGKKFWLPLLIIASISVVLIFTNKRKDASSMETIKRVAIFKYSSRQTLDDTERGYIDGLAEKGFKDGDKVSITRYNAENDLPTAYTIASEIISAKFDIVITASTPAMQVFANANKAGTIIHVFGTVTDPFASGVGIDRANQYKRPEWLVGVGTFQPVEKAFQIAKEMNPGLKKVGVVWCTGETCSEACVKIARRVSDSLGIKLLENTVENSTGVYEAAKALVAKGAEALWIGGDNTVEIAAAMVIKAGDEGKIPVFTNNIDHPAMGAIFGLGANYYDVGLSVGYMAAEILNGKKPIEFSIDNVVPEKLVINKEKLTKFNSKFWKITENLNKIATDY